MPLVGAGPVFVQKLSVGANGFGAASRRRGRGGHRRWRPAGAVSTTATAVMHTATSEPTPLFTEGTLDARAGHTSSRGSAVR